MTRRNLPIHPWLIALFPILQLYSRNLHTVDFSETFAPAALSLLATSILWGILRGLRLDATRSSLIVSTGSLLFFSFGPCVKVMTRLGIGSSPFEREWLVLAVESLPMAGVVALAWKKPDIVRASTSFLNASAVSLIGFSVFGMARQNWADLTDGPPRAEVRPTPRLSPPTGRLPDVYFLVLDAYGRSDHLNEVIGFDNSAFLARLEAKGFSVANRSTANYCQTALSLSSTFNLSYLDELAGHPSDDRLPLRRLISDSAVVRGFRSLGYRVVTFDSGFDATESIASDLILGPSGNLRTFPTLLINQTPLCLLLRTRADFRPQRMHRARILKLFEDLPAAGHPSDEPTFTMAHCLSPHPPFLFGADGRDVSDREGTYSLSDSDGWRLAHGDASAYAERYREQAAYLTSRVEDAVDRILATSIVEPIIIIQGDHGPGSHFEADADEPNDLPERMTVLNAIYLPRAHRQAINPAITPVNTFRLVFDRGFGAKLGLLDDRNYYSTFRKPYVFTEVTGKIDPTRD